MQFLTDVLVGLLGLAAIAVLVWAVALCVITWFWWSLGVLLFFLVVVPIAKDFGEFLRS